MTDYDGNSPMKRVRYEDKTILEAHGAFRDEVSRDGSSERLSNKDWDPSITDKPKDVNTK
jgi:hypothetical protein